MQDKKCGWLFCKAYHELGISPEQRTVFKENYGVWDDEKVATIKKLYSELDMKSRYEKYEEESYQYIMRMRPTVEEFLPWSIFDIFLNKVRSAGCVEF